jgi:hypothetical protein
VPELPNQVAIEELSAAARSISTNPAEFVHITRSQAAARCGPQLSAHRLQRGQAQPQPNPSVTMHTRLQFGTVSEFSRYFIVFLEYSSSNVTLAL